MSLGAILIVTDAHCYGCSLLLMPWSYLHFAEKISNNFLYLLSRICTFLTTLQPHDQPLFAYSLQDVTCNFSFDACGWHHGFNYSTGMYLTSKFSQNNEIRWGGYLLTNSEHFICTVNVRCRSGTNMCGIISVIVGSRFVVLSSNIFIRCSGIHIFIRCSGIQLYE